MIWQSLLATVVLASQAQALIRFPCAQLVTQRFDPLVTPGQVSPHLHQIVGGNAFNLSMDPMLDLPKISTCTSCRFKENKSNYWTAVMYFKHQNGTFIRVPQFANHRTGSPNGGMTIYYIQPPNNSKVTAPPKGFRMITGNPFLRSRNTNVNPNSPEAYALTFRCWDSQNEFDPSNMSPPGGGNYDTIEFPQKKCNGGIRANIFFPSCWNGKDLDTPDHRSHVAFMQGNVDKSMGIILMGGTCPASHPVRIPMILFETAWDTRPFNNMWPSDSSQPFVLSQGDPTGYGHHGDYVFGWEGDSLQRAMDQCTDINGVPEQCRALTVQSDADINKCTQQPAVNERTEGEYLPALPGCNPVQRGPAQATPIANCNAITTTGGVGGPIVTSPPISTPTGSQPPVATPTQPAPGPMQTRYGQCGGQGWNGPTQCTPPYSCSVSNQWYSQCL